MSWQILSPLLIVVAGTILVLLERRFPYDRGQALFREGFFNDFVMYTLVQSYLLGYVIAAIIAVLDRTTGIARLHLFANWPLWAQFLFFFVVHDFYIYWFHRTQHRSKYLWRVHEAHHATRDVDWLSGSRSHALEILINQNVEFAPIALLGTSPDLALMKATLDAVWGMWIHSNIDVRTGVLQYIFNGPEMHRWHHAAEIENNGVNYGTKLAIWDWIFGTGYLPAHKPRGYGLTDVDFPRNFFLQQLFAFRPFRAEPVQPERSASEAGGLLGG